VGFDGRATATGEKAKEFSFPQFLLKLSDHLKYFPPLFPVHLSLTISIGNMGGSPADKSISNTILKRKAFLPKRSGRVQNFLLTKSIKVDMSINMKTKSIEQILRELVLAKGLRKTALDLGIDPASLHRSLRDGSNIKLERVKKLLDYLGYEIRIVRSKKDRG
jgi:DNA-binding phage protein